MGAVLRTFRDHDTQAVFRREFSRRLQGVALTAKRKLDHLNSAISLADLRAVPGNRFEALSGDRAGQYSIRVNDRWRVCFRWIDADAYDIEIVDYH